MTTRVCAETGCPNLTTTTRCDTHTKQRRKAQDHNRPNARQRGYNTQWERTRRNYLAAFPICQHPDGCLNPAIDVHHRDGKGPLGPHGHDWHNLQGLCKPHHSQTTATMQPGGWNQ